MQNRESKQNIKGNVGHDHDHDHDQSLEEVEETNSWT